MQKIIVCTAENGADFQKAVRAWPELHALVGSLQAQNLFPGLRAARITLTGSEEHCAKGLGALIPQKATQGLSGALGAETSTTGEKNDAA